MLVMGFYVKHLASTNDYVIFKKGNDSIDFPRKHPNDIQIVIY